MLGMILLQAAAGASLAKLGAWYRRWYRRYCSRYWYW